MDKSNTNPQLHPLLIVLSGPSGVGKDATVIKMKESGLRFYYTVTTTTRPKRLNEKDKVDYNFISQEQFHQMVRENQFLEWARVYDNYYGSPRKAIKEALNKGLDVIVKVDIQGAASIKRILPDAVFIFLAPPSKEELSERLKQRQTHSIQELDLRLGKAQEEMDSLSLFDYIVISHKDDLDLVISQINAIVTAEKCRVEPRILEL
jgi:guanylate kinase